MAFRLKTLISQKWSLLAVVFIGGCSSLSSGIHNGYGNNGPESASDAADSSMKLITPQLLISEKATREEESISDISQLVAVPAPYTIENGDVLSITVWDHPELGAGAMMTALQTGNNLDSRTPSVPATFIVDHQGIMQFPYVGALKVGGLTEDAARTLLSGKLAYYINKPNITLGVQSYRSKRIYVDGEVKTPGIQPITDIPMTMIEAINRAGGFLPSADQSQIALTRNGSNYRINLPQLVQRGVNPAEIMLKTGDVIRVRSRDESKIFVSGEVIGPRALQMHNGRLSLSEALGASGGINPVSGDSRQVYVVRRTKTVPVVYRLDAYSPGALALAEGFELEPKDIVYVAATPLANWQRIVSQLLPGGLSSAVSTVVPAPR